MKDLTGKDVNRMEKLNSILLNEFCNLKAENERLAKLNQTLLDNATTKGIGTKSFSDKDPDPHGQIPKTKDTGSDYSFTRLW